MAAGRDEAAQGPDRLAARRDDGDAVLRRVGPQVEGLQAGAHARGLAGVLPDRVGGEEGEFFEGVRPDGEGAAADGAAEEIVACVPTALSV